MKLFFAILALVLLPVAFLWDGYVTQSLWLWFAVPLGVPKLTLVGAMGLGVLFSSFFAGTAMSIRLQMAKAPEPEEEDEKALKDFFGFIAIAFVAPAIYLFFGAIINHFQ